MQKANNRTFSPHSAVALLRRDVLVFFRIFKVVLALLSVGDKVDYVVCSKNNLLLKMHASTFREDMDTCGQQAFGKMGNLRTNPLDRDSKLVCIQRGTLDPG